MTRFWAIIPLSRPHMVRNVRRNLLLQNTAVRSIVVENGNGVGACEEHGLRPDVLLRSEEAHQSAARNMALDYLRARDPDSFWVSMDDDDIYRPGYVGEFRNHAERGVILGKKTGWVRFGEIALAFFGHWDPGERTQYVYGHSMGGFVSDTPDFPIVPCGEESGMMDKAKENGCDVFLLSHEHMIVCRRDDPQSHTYQASWKKFWGRAGYHAAVYPVGDEWRASSPQIHTEALTWTEFSRLYGLQGSTPSDKRRPTDTVASGT